MGTEIERKFLLKDDSWQQHADSGQVMKQGYLASNDNCSLRIRVAGEKAWLNIKSATLTIARMEYEYPIPPEDAEEILAKLCTHPYIEKTRYLVSRGHHTWEIDVFSGDNQGLIVAEIELTDIDEAFELPLWVGDEVSDDPRYYNVCLVRHPYKDW